MPPEFRTAAIFAIVVCLLALIAFAFRKPEKTVKKIVPEQKNDIKDHLVWIGVLFLFVVVCTWAGIDRAYNRSEVAAAPEVAAVVDEVTARNILLYHALSGLPFSEDCNDNGATQPVVTSKEQADECFTKGKYRVWKTDDAALHVGLLSDDHSVFELLRFNVNGFADVDLTPAGEFEEDPSGFYLSAGKIDWEDLYSTFIPPTQMPSKPTDVKA